MTRRLALLLFLLSLLCFVALPSALADCPNGDDGDNVIDCTSSNDPDQVIRGGDGDDSITVGENVNIQSITGNGGDDTLINNGNLEYDITGDFLTDEDGDDSIVNNGNAYTLYGDTAYGDGDGGDDTIVNNGSAGSIFGDASGSNGGDDLIINNGNVGFDSYGDIVGDSGTVESGDDTIIVNGNVGGVVSGDTHNFNGDPDHSGDDLIVLQNGAAGGHDNLLLIDGDGLTHPLAQDIVGPIGGDDTLVFDFTTSDEREYDNLVDQFAAAVVSTSTSGSGDLTFRGQTFVWVNIEELRNLIRLIIEESGGSGEVVLGGSAPTADGRLNGMADPVAIYCTADGGVTVYSINGGSGVFLLSASGEQIAAALVQGGLVAEAGGGVLNASGDGRLVFALGGYSFPFSAAACGLAVAAPGRIKTAPRSS